MRSLYSESMADEDKILKLQKVVYANGKWYDGGLIYDRSKWATPILDIDGAEIECWTTEPHDGTSVPEWWGHGELNNEWDYEG